jgi:hypothetical protein
MSKMTHQCPKGLPGDEYTAQSNFRGGELIMWT